MHEREPEKGERIRELREAKGWTQLELAKRAGVTPQSVSRWEQGQSNPRLDQLTRVAEALDVDLSAFAGRKLETVDYIGPVARIMGDPIWRGNQELLLRLGQVARLAKRTGGKGKEWAALGMILDLIEGQLNGKVD